MRTLIVVSIDCLCQFLTMFNFSFSYQIVCLAAIFAFQVNATITSIKKPGAFNEVFTGSDKFIDICSSATAYTLEDGKAAVVYTTGPLAAGTSM